MDAIIHTAYRTVLAAGKAIAGFILVTLTYYLVVYLSFLMLFSDVVDGADEEVITLRLQLGGIGLLTIIWTLVIIAALKEKWHSFAVGSIVGVAASWLVEMFWFYPSFQE